MTLPQARRKPGDGELQGWKDDQPRMTQEEKERTEKVCNEFFETEEYNDKETLGYQVCCETFDFCGVSGWTIFLIILIVLLVLAAAATAFWFFYLRRKLGGKENTEGGDSEESATDGTEISVNTTYLLINWF